MAISDVRQYAHLSEADVEALGQEFDAIRRDIEESLGAKDAAYIRKVISAQRRLAVAGPVGLDERSRDPLLHVGVGHDATGRTVAPLAQRHPPRLHQRARQG